MGFALPLLLIVTGCGLVPVAVPGRTGRSVCPGSVSDAAGTVPAAAADEMERLQALYEDDHGFLAVIWDNRRPVVIVAADQVARWQARLAPDGVAVAPSCIDVALLGLVLRALPLLDDQGVRSAGYDAVDDVIEVAGVEVEALLAKLESLQPGVRDEALAAIADGTLRLGQAAPQGQRQ